MSEAMGPFPDSNDDAYDEWALTVEARIKRLRLETYVTAAVAATALGLGFIAFKGLTGIAKGLADLSQVTGGIHAAVFGQPAVVNVQPRPESTVRADGREVIDETIKPPDTDVAEPVVMGDSADDEVKAWVAGDPISPKDLAKGVDPSIKVDPMMDTSGDQ